MPTKNPTRTRRPTGFQMANDDSEEDDDDDDDDEGEKEGDAQISTSM